MSLQHGPDRLVLPKIRISATTTNDLVSPSTPTLASLAPVTEYQVNFTRTNCDGLDKAIRVGVFADIRTAHRAAISAIAESRTRGERRAYGSSNEDACNPCEHADSGDESDACMDYIDKYTEILERVKLPRQGMGKIRIPSCKEILPAVPYEYHVNLQRTNEYANEVENDLIGVYSTGQAANEAARSAILELAPFKEYGKQRDADGLLNMWAIFEDSHEEVTVEVEKRAKVVRHCWAVLEERKRVAVNTTLEGAKDTLRSRIIALGRQKQIGVCYVVGNNRSVGLKFTEDKDGVMVREEIIKMQKCVLGD